MSTSTVTPQQDWFSQNAPAQNSGDWFDQNAPPARPSREAIREKYDALPLSQKIKLEIVPGAYEKWHDTTFNNGRYSGDNPYEKILRPTVGEVLGGAGDIGEGRYAQGAHRMITGSGTAALPLLPGAISKAPLSTAIALAGGYGGSKLAGGGARMVGATPDQADLASDLGGIIGGGVGAKYGPEIGQYGADIAPQLGNLAIREAGSRVPLLNRFEGFSRPTWGDLGAAFKRDPQLSLYRNTPKLGDSPLQGTSALDRPVIQAATASPQATAQEIPRSVWPPERPSPIQPRDLGVGSPKDILETRSIQEQMRDDLEAHGQQAYSQEKREWLSRNVPGTPKGDLVSQMNAGKQQNLQLGKPYPKANAPEMMTYPVMDEGGQTVMNIHVHPETGETIVAPEGYRPGGQKISLDRATALRIGRQIQDDIGGQRLSGTPSYERQAARQSRRNFAQATNPTSNIFPDATVPGPDEDLTEPLMQSIAHAQKAKGAQSSQ